MRKSYLLGKLTSAAKAGLSRPPSGMASHAAKINCRFLGALSTRWARLQAARNDNNTALINRFAPQSKTAGEGK